MQIYFAGKKNLFIQLNNIAMSMYQMEDLVECSIRQLCATATDLHQLRSDIHYLYEFQNLFDYSFTHFRVLKELLDCGYILLLEPQQHPLYAAEREKFEKILQRFRLHSRRVRWLLVRNNRRCRLASDGTE